MKKFTALIGVFIVSFYLSLSLCLSAFAYVSPGNPTGFVNDFAGVLSDSDRADMEQTLSDFEKQTSTEVVVVTIKSLEGDSVENYAVKLFEEWEIGKKGKDNGVLLLVALDDRKAKIEVGYGLEGALTDLESGQIMNNVIIYYFKKEMYYTGIFDGVKAIMEAVRGEYTAPEVDSESSYDGNIFADLLSAGGGIIFLNIFFLVLFNIFRVFKSAATSK